MNYSIVEHKAYQQNKWEIYNIGGWRFNTLNDDKIKIFNGIIVQIKVIKLILNYQVKIILELT